MSELADRVGLPVATVKYYRRAGLVPPGDATAPNQADYGERHVARLRLVRVLREVADVPVESIRAVVDALDDPEATPHALLGTVHVALAPTTEGECSERTVAVVDDILAAAGWQVGEDTAGRAELAASLDALAELGTELSTVDLDRYVAAVDGLAAAEVGAVVDALEAEGPTAALRLMVVGTVVFERVLVALRRLAHEHHSARLLEGAGQR